MATRAATRTRTPAQEAAARALDDVVVKAEIDDVVEVEVEVDDLGELTLSQAPRVSQAWNAVLGEMPAIGKDFTMEQGNSSYRYRGIEQITAAAANLFAKHGLSVLPTVMEHSLEYWTNDRGTRWCDATLVVGWTIYGPAGDTMECITIGLGRDNSDKAYNKAMSQAFKYLLLPGLMISDKEDEGEHERPEREESAAAPTAEEQAEQEAKLSRYGELMQRAKSLKENADPKFVEALRGKAKEAGFETVNDWGWAQLDAFEESLEKLEGLAQEAAAEEAADEPQ